MITQRVCFPSGAASSAEGDHCDWTEFLALSAAPCAISAPYFCSRRSALTLRLPGVIKSCQCLFASKEMTPPFFSRGSGAKALGGGRVVARFQSRETSSTTQRQRSLAQSMERRRPPWRRAAQSRQEHYKGVYRGSEKIRPMRVVGSERHNPGMPAFKATARLNKTRTRVACLAAGSLEGRGRPWAGHPEGGAGL